MSLILATLYPSPIAPPPADAVRQVRCAGDWPVEKAPRLDSRVASDQIRQRLLDALRQKPGQTRQELTRAACASITAVHTHLHQLIAAGLARRTSRSPHRYTLINGGQK